MEKQPLFTARTAGYHVYRIPGIAVTPNGTVLATAEARRGGGGDWDQNDVVLRRSRDSGRTWDEQRLVVSSAEYGEGPASNFCMIPDPAEECIHAVFCHNYARVYYTRSTDDGDTFSEPREITGTLFAYRSDYAWRVIATGPGHGIRTATGRLIVPVWMSDGSGTEFGSGKLGHRPSVVGGLYSDDAGTTWRTTELVARHGQVVPYGSGTAMIVNPSETIPVERSDGRILFNIRSESSPHKRLVSVSEDGAAGWSTPRFDDALVEPVCMAGITRLDDTGSVLFVNPDNLDHAMTDPVRVNCDRKRLTAKLSTDDGGTWPVSRLIEEGPSGYCDLAPLSDGTVLCLYECGVVSRMYDDKCCMLARFDRDWVAAATPTS